MACTVRSPPPVSPATPHLDGGNYSGHVQLIVGPMFSGKSSELVRRIRRYTHAKLRCLVIKYKADTRYSDERMSTHDRSELDAKPCAVLAEAEESLDGVDVVGIDEGQFFPDLLPFCEKQANAGRIVIVAALDGTFQRLAFGKVCELIPLAERVDKLTAVCKVCAADAAFSKRLTSDTTVEVIGGGDLYWPVCRRCYFTAERPRSRAASSQDALIAEGCDGAVGPSPTPMGSEAAPSGPKTMRKRITAQPPSSPAPTRPRRVPSASGGAGSPLAAPKAVRAAAEEVEVKHTVGYSTGRAI